MKLRAVTIFIYILVIIVSAHADVAADTLEQADAFYKQGQFAKATVAYQRLLRGDTQNTYLRLQLGKSYYVRGLLDHAQRQVDEILLIDTTNIGALLLKGRLYARQKDWVAARDTFQKTVELDGNNGLAYLGLGNALNNLGSQVEADAAFKRFKELAGPDVGE